MDTSQLRKHPEKKRNKRNKSTSFSGHDEITLSEVEKEVMFLITKKYLTPKQIAIRRQTGLRAVQYTIQKLKEKGALSVVNKDLRKKGGGSSENAKVTKKLRLHNEHFNVKIIWWDKKYQEILNKGNMKTIDGNTVMLHKNSLQIYSNMSFYGDTVSECNSKSLSYWTRFISRLESSVKCILMKKDHSFIRRVRGHVAEIENELAEICIMEHDKIRCVGDDGKVWLITDNSFNLGETETIHPEKFNDDMQNVVQPFFNDLRKLGEQHEKIPTMSEILKTIQLLAKQNEQTAIGLHAVTQILNPTKALDATQPQQTSTTHKKINPEYIG